MTYFAATLSDGQTVVRSSATKAYTHAICMKRAGETHWRSSWASSAALAQKNLEADRGMPGDQTEMVAAREVSAAEYKTLKAAWEGTVK